MKIFVGILILIPFFFLVSCNNQDINDRNQLITFDIEDFPKCATVKLSDLGFVDIEYIPLETNEDCMVQKINDLKMGKGFFLTKFSNTILKFRDDGSFVTKIGTVGRGPSEFTVAHDFDIDNKNHCIYIVSAWQKKFFVYSENGDFVRTFQCPMNTTNFKVTDYGILCYNMNSIGNVDFSYNIINTEGSVIFSYPNKYPWAYNKQGTYVFVNENLFYRFNDQVYKKEVYSDTIYLFDNMRFEPRLVIKVGDRLITTKKRSEVSPEYIMENYFTPWNLFEFGQYLYYEFTFKHRIYGFIGSKRNNYKVVINPGEGIINDLDGGPNIWPKTIKDNNIIISWIDALELKTHVSSEIFKNSAPKYPEKKKDIEKLANSIKETDNPVLILVRLNK
jgi:hypothetical protein